jgi:CubicO group peptidase (beta-lactamase class C family)
MNRTTPSLSLALLLSAASCAPAGDGSAGETPPLPPGVSGTALPTSAPAEVGVSADGLDRLQAEMESFVDDGRLPGVLTLVARQGRIVHWEAAGMRSLEAGDPLEPDDIFRIYSMTKPITSVAIMMLVEQGDLALDDPVSTYIPAFAEPEVLEEDGDLEPAARPITIGDLLSHNGGLTYGLFGDTPVDSMYLASGLFGAASLPAFIEIAADLPLVAHPGQAWIYSVSTDVLGRVVEVVSGRRFGEFLHDRIFEPLGMDDTAFWVPEEKRARFMTHYRAGDDGFEVVDSPSDGTYSGPPAMESGGGGLVSTMSDYVRFAQMLLREGELDGVRLLRPETVRAMRTNRLAEEITPISIPGWISPAYGFGLGFATLLDAEASPEPDHTGVFRWGGVANTFFWIDPEAELIAMVWTQMDPFLVHGVERRFQTLVYEALLSPQADAQ